MDLKGKDFVDHLKLDLIYPLEYEGLFDGIGRAGELPRILANKNSFVGDKIHSCGESLRDVDVEDLVERGLVEKRDIGEIVVKESFALKGSLRGHGVAVRGPVGFEKDVVIGRSTIIGPAYVSEGSKIFDSLLRGGPGGSVYIGRNCSLWDYTVIIRSLIGDSSLIHTCNLDDSIIGPDSNFGATRAMSSFRRSGKNRPRPGHQTLLGQRIVLANYSYGNKIRIFDPVTENVVQVEATHFGTLSGTGVWLASGTMVYPGTIIGSGAKVNSTIPLIGYVPPDQTYSLFVSVKKDRHERKAIQLKGTLAQQMQEHSARSIVNMRESENKKVARREKASD